MNKLGMILVLMSLMVLMISVIVWAKLKIQGKVGDVFVTRKNLGDINGDGKEEIAIETTTWNFSSYYLDVKILSGNRTVLTLPIFIMDNIDNGYRIIGKQIIVWMGDLRTAESKWKPCYYNFVWYKWDTRTRQYLQVSESYTKKSYDCKTAQKEMPRLAVNYSQLIVRCPRKTFDIWALELARKQLHFHFTKALKDTKPSVGNRKVALCFAFVPPYKHDLDLTILWFKRDGTWEFSTQ